MLPARMACFSGLARHLLVLTCLLSISLSARPADLLEGADGLFIDGFEGPANLPPTVDAGPDLLLTLSAGEQVAVASLAATVDDDGIPAWASTRWQWSLVAAPGTPPLIGFDDGGPGGLTPGIELLTPTVRLGAVGDYVLRLSADDGILASSDTLTITVLAAPNQAPVMLPPGDRVLTIGEAFDLILSGNDPNSGDTLVYSLLQAPAGAELDPPGSGRIRFLPGATGDYGFTTQVSDQGGLSDQASFVLSVVPGNRAPLWLALPGGAIAAQVPYVFPLGASDPDGDTPLNFTLLAAPSGAQLSGYVLTWTPDNSQLGAATLKLRVADPSGASSDALATLDVRANAAPVAHDDVYQVRIGETLEIPAPGGVLSNDTDPDGETLSALKQSDPDQGVLTLLGLDGSLSYQAPAVAPPPSFATKAQRWIKDSSNFSYYTQPLVADMNSSGGPDLVGTVLNNDLRVYAGATGLRRNEWTIPSDCGFHWLSNSAISMALGNVDDDPAGSVEYVTLCDGERVVAFGAGGAVRWISPSIFAGDGPGGNTSGLVERAPTLTRLTANGGVKVLIPLVVQDIMGTGAQHGCRILTNIESHEGVGCHAVIQIDGATGTIERRMLTLRPAGLPALQQDIFSYRRAFLSAVVADIDGDGVVEIISGPSVYNNDGSLRWSQPRNPADTGVADLDGDGRAEVVMVADQIFSDMMQALYVYDSDGVERFRLPLYLWNNGQNMWPRLTMADVDGDERPEIIFAAAAQLWVLDGFGRVRWTRAFSPDPLSTPLFQIVRATVFDLDNDGQPEVIVKNSDQILILSGADGHTRAKFRLLGPPPDDTVADNFPFRMSYSPIIADADGDGHADIVVHPEGRPQSGGVLMITGANDDWAPAPRIWNQTSYNPNSVDDQGQILFDGSVPTSYVQQKRLATPGDQRGSDVTRFVYRASDGGLSSPVATVTLQLQPTNRPPTITSPLPPATRLPGPFALTFSASDPDPGDALTWTLGQDGCPVSSLDASSGAFNSFMFQDQDCLYVVQVSDSQGALDTQQFRIRASAATATVPDLTGLREDEVLPALQLFDLSFGDSQYIHHAAPVGQVLAQTPAPDSVQPVGTAVSVTVSLGPAPVVVPNLLQKLLSTASSTLTALGLTAQVTRVFSNSIPAEQVMAQFPPAGTELVPASTNPVALTVSAGNGLSLFLDRSAVLAGGSIAVGALASNPDGSPAPLPALDYAISLNYPSALGAPPSYANGSIATSADTLGSFTLTATDGIGNRSASVDFSVLLGAGAGPDSATAMHAQLASVLEGIEAIGRQLRIAQAADDVPAMTQGLTDIVTLWRGIDLSDLRLAPPLVLPQGFVPSPEEMLAFGVTPGPDDALIRQVLQDGAADLAAFSAGLRGKNTSIAALNQLADQFSVRAARLHNLRASEYGTVAALPETILLLNHRIPEFYEALTNELAPVVGLPRRAADFPLATGSEANGGGSVFMPEARGKSSLAELAVTQAVAFITDKIMEKGSAVVANAKQFARDIHGQAAYGAAALAATQHLRQFAQGLELTEVVSGASLSFRVFGPPAFIEVPGNVESPDLNSVMIVGKTLLERGGGSITALVEAIKQAYSFGVDAANNALRCKNGNECFAKVKALIDGMQETLTDPAQNVVRMAQSFYQWPTHIERGCVFALDPGCVQLHYANGFASVYEYAPPATLGAFTGLPTPVIVIVQDEVSGLMYFGTPVFFPSLPPEAP